METVVVSTADAEKAVAETAAKGAASPSVATAERYFPSSFRLPMQNVGAGEDVDLSVSYVCPMRLDDQTYSLRVPLVVDAAMLPSSAPSSMATIYCQINAGTTDVRWGSSSHRMNLINHSATTVELTSDPSAPWNRDFEISYDCYSDQILATSICEPAGLDPAEADRGYFSVMIAPPKIGSVASYFGRKIVFLVDKSGSMSGQPFVEAVRAVLTGLGRLHPEDIFNIIFFNAYGFSFRPGLVQANATNLDMAKSFVASFRADGGTDIMSPVVDAMTMLSAASSSPGVPFIFLLTDGAVSNEREICRHVMSANSGVRLITCGIGPYANEYFLKTMASAGRGFFDRILDGERICEKMSRLLWMAEYPILTDITVNAGSGAGEVSVFPSPSPDLFCGAPILLCGTYRGFGQPESIAVSGRLPDGTPFAASAVPATTRFVWARKLYWKGQLDSYVQSAWLRESPEMQATATAVSCQQGIVCPYTTMVAYQTTPDKKREAEEKKKSGGGGGGTAALLVGGLAVGAVVYLAVTHPGVFGNAGATAGNWMVGKGMVDLTMNGVSVVVESGSALADGFASAAQGAQGCCNCDGVVSCCNSACSSLVDCTGRGCQHVGVCCSDFCEALCNAVSPEDIGHCLQCFCECFCSVLGAICGGS